MLQNNHIYLRAPEPEDLDILYKWENDSTLWKFGSTLSPISKFTLKEYIANSNLDIFEAKQLRLMIILKDSKQPIGTIDLFDFDPFHRRAAIGILVDASVQKQGMGTETLELIKNYCFKFLQLHQIYAHVPSANTPSLHLFDKCGFIRNGLLREWLNTGNGYEDVVWMQCFNPNH
jgi:Acetyltransferases, including N-acetylases of ribosomal proteins